MSKYYKDKDIFQVLDKIFQNAPEEVIDAIKSVDLVIEINKLPIIDIVRCGDCKWFENVYPTRCKRLFGMRMDSERFCSYGERREK